MTKRSIIWTISILAISAAVYLLIPKSNTKDASALAGAKGKKAPKVDAIVLSSSHLINEISVYGNILAIDEVELKNEVPGRIVHLNLPEGKFVKKGTLLVKIYDEDLQANLKKLQNQLSIQEQILKRQTELLKSNGISQNEYDMAVLQVSSIKAEIDALKANIRKTEILAPFDGVIGLRNVSEGAVISTSTVLVSIRTDNKLKLDFSVPEKYGHTIKVGQIINFTVSNSDKSFSAKIAASEMGIQAETRDLKFRAVIQGAGSELIPGAFASVKLKVNDNQNALMIPTQAIIPSEKGKNVIIAQNGKAHLVLVKTGIRQKSLIEIIDGLSISDTVITSGLMFLKENTKLEYSKILN